MPRWITRAAGGRLFILLVPQRPPNLDYERRGAHREDKWHPAEPVVFALVCLIAVVIVLFPLLIFWVPALRRWLGNPL